MTISRGQMNRQLYRGGGIMGLSKEGIGGGDYKGYDMGSRVGFGILKKITGGVRKAVKGVTGAVKDIASSDIGKAALLYGATAGLGSIGSGQTGLARFAPSNFMGNVGRIGSFITGGFPGNNINDEVALTGGKNIFQKALSAVTGGGIKGNIGKFAALAGVTTFLTGTLGMSPEQAEEEVARDPSKYLSLYYKNLNPNASEEEVQEFVTTNTSEYAEGGRIGYAMGSAAQSLYDVVIGIIQEDDQANKYANSLLGSKEFREGDLSPNQAYRMIINKYGKNNFAQGGRIGYAEGTEEPLEPINIGIGTFNPQRVVELYEKAKNIPKNISLEDISLEDIKGIPKRLMEGTKSSVSSMVEPLGNEYRAYMEFLSLPKEDKKKMEEMGLGIFDVFKYLAMRDNKAQGGRIGYQDAGPVLPEDPTKPVNPFAPKPTGPVLPNKMMASNMENEKILEALFEKFLDMGLSPEKAAEEAKKEFERMSMMQTEGRGLAAMGGRMNYALGDTASQNAMQAAGIEGLPMRQNPKGVQELDLRDNGGFIPPVGIKEKEDDIPAMLSNNEFVFTADAVRGMGDGDVELGAQRMYDQMKMLEKGGRV